ncbi:MAG: GNAT family N-acetyltransferase [Pirellulales bacterium]|nr:GNAT family N-acetyltransferase [Pirellulales bacterium]
MLDRLTALGHEIGLHYDLATYPDNEREAAEALLGEAELLGKLCGQKIRTIAMHNPSLGGEDWFRQSDQFVHPHDPRWQDGLLYVSDSCRAWRDENLLKCFSQDPPKRLMLLTHPEVWLDGSIDDRQDYLEQVLEPVCGESLRRYLLTDVAAIWQNHAGARAHDAREHDRSGDDETRYSWPTRSSIENQLEAIETRFHEFIELPWTREQILLDLPGKWKHTLLMHHGPTVAGFSFNSVKGESLYIHALFVAPEFRRRGFGGRMIEMVCRRAQLFGFTRVGLRVASSNHSAAQFYAKQGFVVTGNAGGTGDVEMEKAVA